MLKTTQIGLFGGTFDPIHYGHLRVAVEVRSAYGLNKIYIIPAALSPHKISCSMADAKDRFQMIRDAVSKDPGFKVSDVELKRDKPSYTIETVSYFKSTLPRDTSLFLIMGVDAFLEIETWKSYKKLFKMTALIVVTRPGLDCNDILSMKKRIEKYLFDSISPGYSFSSSTYSFRHPEKKPIFLFETTPMNISSSKIRQLVKKGRLIKYLVPYEVETFINKQGLYL